VSSAATAEPIEMLSRDGPGNVLHGGVDAHALPTSSIKALKAIFQPRQKH